jgi:magnesium-transporting ATPase (P-type)
VHGLAPQRQVSVHDLQPELDSAEAAQSEPDEGTMEQLCRRSSPTLELEVLDAHSPIRFADDGMSPPAPREEQVELMAVMPSPSLAQPSPLAVPVLHRAVSVEEELPPTRVEKRSEHEERELALRIADRMLGSKAQRSAATTREDKEAPVRAWLLACSDAPSAWSCTTLGSSINGLPSSASEPRIEVFGTNHLSVQHPALVLSVVRARVLGCFWRSLMFSLCSVSCAEFSSASKPPTWYSQLFWCFLHPFNVLLSVLAIIAGSTDDINSVVLICAMVSISVGIAFVQERRALISALALSKRITHKVRVRRPVEGDAKGHGSHQSAVAPAASSVAAVQSTHLSGAVAPAGAPYRFEEIPSHELVPGDIVLLSAGSLVPADLRLLSCSQMLIKSVSLHITLSPVQQARSCVCHNADLPFSLSYCVPSFLPSAFLRFLCSQTILTGESVPAEKYAKRYRPHDASHNSGELAGHTDSHFLRRPNLAFMSTVVESGSGMGIVLCTGSNSYFGANAKELQHPRPQSAFAKGVKQVSYVLMGFTAIMLPIVIIVNGLVKKDWTEAALFGAAVAVGITPVMLPMIVSGNLSLAAHNLAKRKCLVKRLEAVQNMGATTILATDKTGTLTNDHVSLHSAVTSDGAAATRALHVAYVIAAKQEGFRNVLDRAILEYAETGPEEAAARKVAEQEHEHKIAVVSLERSLSRRDNIITEENNNNIDHNNNNNALLASSPSASPPAAAVGAAKMSVALPEVHRRIVLPSAEGSYRKVAELPFDFRRRRMSIILDVALNQQQPLQQQQQQAQNGANGSAQQSRADEEVVSLLPDDYKTNNGSGRNTIRMLYCKGALAEMLRSCSHYRASEADMSVRPLDQAGIDSIKKLGESLAAEGLRVLAVAEKRMEVPQEEVAGGKMVLPTVAEESNMTMIGFLTFMDTPKVSDVFTRVASTCMNRSEFIGMN